MSLFIHRPLPIRCQSYARAFSTTVPRSNTLHIEKNDPELVRDTVPEYPYGPARWYKQSNSGLYGSSRIRFGNNVGPKFKTKTRRSWEPNIVRKRLWSHALGRHVQIKVQARVLRTIDKLGGLDEYLLGIKEQRIKDLGMSGWWLRWAIMQTPKIKRRFKMEREELGVPSAGIEKLLRESPTTPEGEAQMATKGQDTPGPLITRRSATFQKARVLKFRVGRSAHFVYTPVGWRPARPHPLTVRKKAVLHQDRRLGDYVDTRMKELRPAPIAETIPEEPLDVTPPMAGLMEQVTMEQGVQLTPKEEKAVRQAVARALRAKQDELVEEKLKRQDETEKARIARLGWRKAMWVRKMQVEAKKKKRRSVSGFAV